MPSDKERLDFISKRDVTLYVYKTGEAHLFIKNAPAIASDAGTRRAIDAAIRAERRSRGRK